MKLGLMRVAISFLIFASAAGARPSAHPASFTLPFELIDNRVFIEVRLNGHGPYHFILDTGAEGTISDRVAQELGLKVQMQDWDKVWEPRGSTTDARRSLRF